MNLGSQIVALFSLSPGGSVGLAIAIYGLVVVAALLRDVIHAPLTTVDGTIAIRSGPRWMVLALLGAVQVATCFAVILLKWGHDFKPPISDPTTALYQSAVTFTTLGYGEITPATQTGKIIVLSELCFFFVVFAARLPLAVSVLRVRSEGSKTA